MNNLKKLRLERDLKQKDVAKVLGITTSYYGMIEIGKRKVSLDIAFKLSNYYGVSVENLFKIKEEEKEC